MGTTEYAWDYQELWAKKNDEDSLCLLDLRRRVEALEQRATPAPEPAPAADRPLWREVRGATQAVPGEFDWVAAQLAVADWLAARGYADSADLLRAEARRAWEGA